MAPCRPMCIKLVNKTYNNAWVTAQSVSLSFNLNAPVYLLANSATLEFCLPHVDNRFSAVDGNAKEILESMQLFYLLTLPDYDRKI
jgi:hypothetical protein